MKTKKCDVCGKDIKVDEFRNGKCKNCGWNNDENALIYPDAINPPNFMSLNEAIYNYKKNIKYKPTFDRIVELLERGLDVMFKYKGNKYQLSRHNDYTIWEYDTKNYISYPTIEQFKEKAEISGVPLKDLWEKVNFIKYDC